MFTFSETTGLAGLALSSFVSATLLPGGSELVLLAVLNQHPASYWPAIAVATGANTVGGMTSYLIGRLFPNRVQSVSLERLRRYGYPALLLSWLPVLGDALCVAAGWLRFNVGATALALAIGKGARYVALASGWAWWAGTF